jgi:hypothetical protein
VGAENPIHFTNAPYLLSNGFRSGLNFGSVLLPGSSDDKCYSFQADDSGAVQGLECVLREGDRESESEDRIAEGSGLRTKTMPRLMLSQANGSLDRKHRFRVDMRPIYKGNTLTRLIYQQSLTDYMQRVSLQTTNLLAMKRETCFKLLKA